MAKLLWTEREDIGPPARDETDAAYDATHQQTVLFGGWKSGPLNDTWAWNGELWTQLEDIGPPGRANHGMAFDTVRELLCCSLAMLVVWRSLLIPGSGMAQSGHRWLTLAPL